jgi:hypothetical protein
MAITMSPGTTTGIAAFPGYRADVPALGAMVARLTAELASARPDQAGQVAPQMPGGDGDDA